MNIALLTTTWYPDTGGGIIHVKELANRLVDDYDCSVTIITKSGGGNKEAMSDISKSVSIIRIPGTNSRFRPLNELRYTAGVLRHVVKNNYDIVHAHTNTATFPLQILNLGDYLTVITVHGAQLDLTVTFTDSILDPIYSFTRQLILQRF
ncbi:glycosyltransferase, partial [Halorubrum sp. Atlit-26R]|uniref:glycosyltransferase n=1 Tax=Halorubrum sp. Atlit-26R TaxID=2282128 RepID=UPI000F261F3E